MTEQSSPSEDQSPKRTGDFGKLWWVPFLILLAGHLPLVTMDMATTWQRSHYQFFPFAFLAYVLLLWSRQNGDTRRSKVVVGILVIDVLLLLTAAAVRSPWLATVGMWHLLLAAALSRTDKETGNSLGYLAFIPLLAVRLPANSDLLVIRELQDITSRVSSRILDLVGCLHLRDGNVITLRTKTLLVEEACSGIQSLFTLVFLAILICLVKRRRLFHALAIVGGAFFFAGLMNVLRVISIALAEEWWKFDLTTGLNHDVLGYVVLALAAGLVYNFDMFVAGFTEPVPDASEMAPNAEFRNPLVVAFNWFLGSTPLHRGRTYASSQQSGNTQSLWKRKVIICAIVSVLGLAAQAPALLYRGNSVHETVTTGVDLLDESSLESEIAGFIRSSYSVETRSRDDQDGEFSNVWDYQNTDLVARVASDHLFCDGHDLRICYEGIGWKIEETRHDKTNPEWPAMSVKLKRQRDGIYGMLLFSFFTSSRRPCQLPESQSALSFVRNRIASRPGFFDGESDPYIVQCQTFSESLVPFSDLQISALRELHMGSREQMRLKSKFNTTRADNDNQ